MNRERKPGAPRSPSSRRATAPAASATIGRHNPRLARLRRIARGEDPDLTVADGMRLIADLVAAGVAIEELYLADDALHAAASSGLGESTAPTHVATRPALDAVAPTRHCQGALAVVRRPHSRVPERGVLLYLDRIQDPGNVGAVIRCAAALDGSAVICSAGCADPFSPRAIRGSAGHALLLPVATGAEFAPLAERVRAAGGEAVATVAGDGTTLTSWRPRLPLLVAFGNEGEGLAPEVLRACSGAVSIPLSGSVESLNIAVAAGIVLAAVRGLLPHLY